MFLAKFNENQTTYYEAPNPSSVPVWQIGD
jgi:hypothetical protein